MVDWLIVCVRACMILLHLLCDTVLGWVGCWAGWLTGLGGRMRTWTLVGNPSTYQRACVYIRYTFCVVRLPGSLVGSWYDVDDGAHFAHASRPIPGHVVNTALLLCSPAST